MTQSMSGRWFRVLRTPIGLTATILTLGVLTLAVVAPILWTDQADAIDTSDILAGPSAEHWAGTDNLGRDIFYRVLVATRLSVELALLATAIAVVVGLVLGTAPFLLGRRSGRTVTASVNLAVAFPGLLLALFFAVIFGVGAKGAVLAIGLAGAPTFGRLTQTLVAGVAARDYVAVARTIGVGRVRILLRHVLPNVSEPLVVNATIGAGGALLAFAGLSFLGLGVQAPRYDWGRLLYDGIGAIYVNPAAALAPGIAVLVAGLAFNLFGESVAKGLGIGIIGGVRPLLRGARRDRGADDDSGHRHAARLVRPGARRPRPVRHLPRAARPDPPGARRELLGPPRRGGRRGGGVRVGQVAHRAGGLAPRVRSRPRGRHPARAARQRPEGPGARQVQRRLLGTSLAMVFQDPMTSFNPTRRIGGQLAEVSRHHHGLDRKAALARAVDRLQAVRITDPERSAHQYPHEFSGGMRQRAMIGMGLMGTPALIVADEPTTALDVTVQQQVLDLLASIRETDRVALVLISHDVTVVSEVCDRVLVMYAGRIVEDLPAAELTTGRAAPLHAGVGGRRPGHGHRPGPAACRHSRATRRPRRPACGMCVRRPVSARVRAVPDRGPRSS